ncbi:hypothetical protein [Microbacterium sp.]|uniref:hypothetical protein n=1 Tax=Microbacterium sp. TaxID=51671 RepID=UPI002733381D|nr:hypothetical protein [Microbacterium sp.]MDP3949107.1 hypothetical protein [Microbacterium sp.]
MDSEIDDDTREVFSRLAEMSIVVRSQSGARTGVGLSDSWLVSVQHELVYALLAHAAREADVDIVFIKGPVLFAQGLRTREHSGDVDCWVRPGGERALAAAIAPWGWRIVPTAFDGTAVAHSVTLVPGEWGCEIDVHWRFPGMTLDPDSAFDLVHESAEQRVFAGATVRTPSPAMHAVIYALHELRPVSGRQYSDSQFQSAVMALTAAGPQAIDIASRVGAGYVLHEALQLSFPNEEVPESNQLVPEDWEWRKIVSVPQRQLAAVRNVDVWQRPRVIFRLLWPTRDTSRRIRDAADASPRGLRRVKVKRLWDGIRTYLRAQ